MTFKSFVPDSYNWIVGPTYKLGEKEFRVVWADYKKLGLLKYCRKSYSPKQGDMRITTPWNSVVEVVSADNQDSLLGEGLSHAVMAESARHTQPTWEQYIEPALSDLLGTCDFPSTPQGFNWYHGLWLLGQDTEKNPSYKSWRFPSWTNPVRYPDGLKNAEIIRIRATVSRTWFEQEYGANFTTLSGAIYEEWDESVHVQSHIYQPAWPNFLAFDYGFANPFVALDIQVAPNEDIYVWREYYLSYKSTMEHGQFLKERANPEGYNVQGMWGDPRGADEAATLSLIIGYVGSQDVPWKHGVEEIKRRLKARPARLFVDPSCTNLRRQMGQLHVKRQAKQTLFDLNETSGDGNIQHKVDDHAADALRYFVGPMFVLGMGMHLEDLYGAAYVNSESQRFYNANNEAGFNMSDSGSMVLDEELSLNAVL